MFPIDLAIYCLHQLLQALLSLLSLNISTMVKFKGLILEQESFGCCENKEEDFWSFLCIFLSADYLDSLPSQK